MLERFYGAGGAGGNGGAEDGDWRVVSVGGGVVGVVTSTVAVTGSVPSVAVMVAGACFKPGGALEGPLIPSLMKAAAAMPMLAMPSPAPIGLSRIL
ncbi:hypothetical protein B1987_09170 [Mycobacterium kansasii]|nr:hypothetical protein B1987_09170 [Mycobacterium kansasii]